MKLTAALPISELWHSGDANDWENALKRYWDCVKQENLELERWFEDLDVVECLCLLDANGWYRFLRDKYFLWKYTDKRRYATTTQSASPLQEWPVP